MNVVVYKPGTFYGSFSYPSRSQRRNCINGDRGPNGLLVMVYIIPIDLVVDVVVHMAPEGGSNGGPPDNPYISG